MLAEEVSRAMRLHTLSPSFPPKPLQAAAFYFPINIQEAGNE